MSTKRHSPWLGSILTHTSPQRRARTRSKKQQTRAQSRKKPPPQASSSNRPPSRCGSTAFASSTASGSSRMTRFSDNTLHPERGALAIRLDHVNNTHFPTRSPVGRGRCGLHRYVTGKEKLGDVVYCDTCQVCLFKDSHTIANIQAQKRALQRRMEASDKQVARMPQK